MKYYTQPVILVRLEFVFRAVLRASLVFFADSNLGTFFGGALRVPGGERKARLWGTSIQTLEKVFLRLPIRLGRPMADS
jgi:hypothetical protein